MKKQGNIDTVLDMVEAFLVQKRYQRMAREDEEFASLIDDRLVENGVYKGEHLSDEAFRELIRKQYLDVVEISDNGFLYLFDTGRYLSTRRLV